MNRVLTIAALATAAILASLSPSHAENGPPPIDPAKGAAFDTRMFGAPVGKKAAYACFVRHYDEGHLRQHPLQKVAAMKLLVTAQDLPKNNPPPIRSSSESNTATARLPSTRAAIAATL